MKTLTALLLLTVAMPQLSQEEKELRQYIRDRTVCIENKGSGVLLKDQKVLTAYHVIRSGYEDYAAKKSKAEPPVYHAIESMVEDGKYIGQKSYIMDVVAVNKDKDLALLQLRSKNFKSFVKISENSELPKIDSVLYHCGTFHGVYEKSVSKGTLQGLNYGALKPTNLVHHADFTTYPGSSGGGVWAENKELLGIVIENHGQNNSFFVPSTVINEWLNSLSKKKKK